jgi:hypothetical protein
MTIDYILTTFSPAMFGDRATTHIRLVDRDEAMRLASDRTQVVATRFTHERLAKLQFPHSSNVPTRYANMRPGVNAIAIHYRGAPLPDSGEVPPGSVVTFYLIEVEDYQDAETD